jgi:hypothetical protein
VPVADLKEAVNRLVKSSGRFLVVENVSGGEGGEGIEWLEKDYEFE